MKRPLLTLGLFGLLLLGWDWTAAPGTDEPPAASRVPEEAALSGIAVIDIDRVFREHRPFQEGLNRIRQEMQQAQQTVALRQIEIETAQRKLQGLRPGTPEHEQTQLLLTRLQTELQLFAERQKQQFANQEMVLYADTYGKVSSAVEQYAQTHGLRLVLRSHDGAMNPDDRNSVIGFVNRAIVYQQGLDITTPILDQLNAG